MDFNGDLNLATLQPAPVFPELYQELWWYSGGSVSASAVSVAGNALINKGNTSTSGVGTSAHNLFTLSSSWSASQQYALEISLTINATPNVAYAELWDMTSNTAVSGSQISMSSITFTVLRSGQFTLTPGHTYGITIWCSTGQVYLTDASLIIFPSVPLTSPSVSAISLANPSGNGLKEAYIPLWVYSSGNVSTATVAWYFIYKGSNGGSNITSAAPSQAKLYTLSSSWSPSQKFAFEASFWSGSSSVSASVALVDITNSNSIVSASELTTTATNATVMRSGSFTLTPGHIYGVAQYVPSSNNCFLTKAHLVALA